MEELAKEFYVAEDKIWFTDEAGWSDEVPKNVALPQKTLGQMLDEAVEEYGDHRAIWFLETNITFKQFGDMVDRFATALHQAGLRKGDVLALILPNSIQYVVAYYACAKLGAIASGVNPTYKAMEVLHQLRITKAKAVIFLDALYEEMLLPIRGQHKFDFMVATNIVNFADGIPKWKQFLGKLTKKIPTGTFPKEALSFKKMLETEPNLPDVQVSAADIHTYIMTGGTTGVPKAAVLSHFNCVSNAIQLHAWMRQTREHERRPGACVVGVLPLFHSFAMSTVMNLSVYGGFFMMLFPRPPEIGELLRTIKRVAPDRGTNFPGVEVLFKRIADFEDIDKIDIFGKLALCMCGAGPLHKPIQEAFEAKTGARLTVGYGLTEASPVVSVGPIRGERRIDSIGLPIPSTDWKIMDSVEFGQEKERVPLGEEPDQDKHMGEICVAGPQVMVGYLEQPEDTAETIIEHEGKRWLLTGDIGFMDELGRVYIRDRKKQLIKYKGYSVFPYEVESLVCRHEAVSEVAVAGIPDAATSEKIKAWVVLKDEWSGKISEQELMDWCRENMTHYKVPYYIEFRSHLPTSLVGKVLRRELQENDPLYKKYHDMTL